MLPNINAVSLLKGEKWKRKNKNIEHQKEGKIEYLSCSNIREKEVLRVDMKASNIKDLFDISCFNWKYDPYDTKDHLHIAAEQGTLGGQCSQWGCITSSLERIWVWVRKIIGYHSLYMHT